MKRLARVCVFLLAVSIFPGAAWAAQPKSLDDLLAERSANVWIDGQVLGDLVLGAKARLTFVYVDTPLATTARNDPGAPEWLTWHSRHLGEKYLKGRALFILRFETFTPWELVPGKLFVGTYAVSSEDVLSRKEYTPSGELPSGFTGTLPFSVPKTALKTGAEVALGYEKEAAKWKMPEK
jgi:hypothetical protein